MADTLILDGVTIAPNVITTIVSIASREVEGVSDLYVPTLRKAQGARAVEVVALEDGKLALGIHLAVFSGTKLHEVAAAVQKSVADALAVQVGIEPASIDIFIDSLVFAE